MNPTRFVFRPWLPALLALGVATFGSAAIIAPNDPPDLSAVPPDLAASVDPNIVVTFDDSGSMTSNFMGDTRPFDGGGWNGGSPNTNPWFCAGVIDPGATSGIKTTSMNGVYYNPNVLYTPPLRQDGTSFPNADATLAAVLADGVAANRPSSPITPATAGYNNNPNSAAGGNDTKVTIINGALVTNVIGHSIGEFNTGSSAQCTNTNANVVGGSTNCGPVVNPGATITGCTWNGKTATTGSSSNLKKCSWTETYNTTTQTDNRWVCGSASGSPTNGPNPKLPTTWWDGTDASAGGPYYYRLKSSVSIAVDAFNNPTAAGLTTLYTASNWEPVPVPNTPITIGTTTVSQWQNFANWYAYYRTRNLMTRTALSRVFGVLGDNIRVAWQNINSNLLTSSTIITNLNNSNTSAPNYRTNFFNWIFGTGASGSTPDRAATIRAGEFYKRNTVSLTDPYYDPGVNADLGCRQNFHMLVTDGYWNEGDPTLPTGFFTALSGPPGGKLPDNTPYSTSDLQTQIYWDTQGSAYTSSMANIGFYYWAQDLRPDLAPTATPSLYHSKVPTYVKDQTVGVTTGSGASSAAQTEEIYYNPNNDSASWRHVVQFMVTLGVAGNLDYSTDTDCVLGNTDACHLRKGMTNSTNAHGWPTPVNNSPPAIDDTWHGAVNSRGSYFSASNPANLVSHLTDIINSIIARSGQSSAESVSTSILNQGAVGYQAGYNSSGWTGYVYKQKLDPNTAQVVGSPLWDAGCLLTGGLCAATGTNVGAARDPNSRIIFTSVGSPGSLQGKPFQWTSLGSAEQAALSLNPTTTHPDTTTTLVPTSNGTTDVNGSYRLLYLRGDRSYESAATPTAAPVSFRPRSSVLGAIINSQAVYEGAPAGNHLDNYPVGSPEQVAGLAGNSYEQFVKANINRSPTIYAGANDGMLHAFDAGTGAEKWAYVPNALYANGQLDQLTNAQNGLTVTVDDSPIRQDVFVNGAWRTMLVGSTRLGGRGVYALDITDQGTPGSEATAAGKFMWEFTSAQDSDLGYTYASANIARIRCNVSPCSGTGTPGGTWVVIVAGGYFPKVLPGQTNGQSATDTAVGVTNTTSYLWVLNAADGKVIKKIATKSGVISYGMSTPILVDFGLDQIDDLAVAGDLAGNLWRFDISNANPANWKVDVLFESYANTTACGTTNPHGVGCEPITVVPIAFPDPVTGSVVYLFGSGEYLGNSDRTSSTVYTPQHFFGVRDYGTGNAAYPFHEADLATQTMTQDSNGFRSLTYTPTASQNTPARGWQIPLNLANGERDVATLVPLYSSNTAIFVSLIPGTNNDPCNPGRQGAILVVNAADGGPPVPATNGATSLPVGYVVSNPPASGGATGISVIGGGKIILPGLISPPPPPTPIPYTDPICKIFPNMCQPPPNCQATNSCGCDPSSGTCNNNGTQIGTPIWRRTSWNEMLNDL